MNRDDLLYGTCLALTVFGAAEIILRFKDRSDNRIRFMHEKRTVVRSWERFDPLTGWELVPGYAADDIRINRHGFRGPELMRGEKLRIMCLGDSNTFGPLEEKYTYPTVLQEKLVKHRMSRPVEVINAGVTGHSTNNMLYRLKRLMSFKPEIIIISAGWNDIYSEAIDKYTDNRNPYSSYWHFLSQKNIHCHVISKIREAAGITDRKPLPLSYSVDEFVPFNFEYNLKKILTKIKKASIQPALLTLPKLIPNALSRLTVEIKKKALLPDFLKDDDYKGFIKLYKSYDSVLRQVANELEIPLIDVVAHFNKLKDSRISYFEDNRHLTPKGSKALGEFVAESLIDKGIIQ
ncbi:MAG: hypothetical protein JXB48_11190 [Candidatus Latescibacteria bacterium]|nr:hypothetical protein [Candidatus Latescibacterota bacterium]